MHECRSSSRQRGSNRVWGHRFNFKIFDIATPVTELMPVTDDETLLPATSPEFAHKEFGLALAAAEIRGEINMACWLAQFRIRL